MIMNRRGVLSLGAVAVGSLLARGSTAHAAFVSPKADSGLHRWPCTSTRTKNGSREVY